MAYTNQGGVKNYLGNQKMVKAPLHWQSAPNHPTTELAYITKKEKDLLIKKDLHKSLKGGVNRGPSGIISLNGWGSRDAAQNRAGADISAAMDRSGSDPGWSPSAGGGGSSAVAAQTISPAQLQLMHERKGGSTVLPESTFGRTYRRPRGGVRGFFGGLGRGIMSVFGGIPGRVAAGLSTAKDFARRTGAKIGEFGEEVEEFGQYPTLDRWLNRNTDKYKDKPYHGQGQGYDFNVQDTAADVPFNPNARIQDTSFSPTPFISDYPEYPIRRNQNVDRFANTIAPNPINYNIQPNNEIFTDQNLMAFKPNTLLDQKINQAYNTYNQTGFGRENVETLMDMDIKNKEKTGDPLSLPAKAYTMFGAQGGRAGYRNGEFVDENINVEGPGFDVNENIEMASSPHPDESWLGLWEELDGKGMVPLEIETLDDFKHWFHQQDFDMGSMSEDQGIASLV